MIEWARKLSSEVLVSVVAGLALALLGLGYAFFYQEWLTPEKPITIDLTDQAGCRPGKLSDIARQFFPQPNTILSNGATVLTICHKDRLISLRAEVPRKLANLVPGCLVWQRESTTMAMVRKSPAICELLDHSGYICDGMNAAHPLGASALGNPTDRVNPCSPDLLRRFGL